MFTCNECNEQKENSDKGEKPGFCKACCALHRCPVCQRTTLPRKAWDKATALVSCNDCSTQFRVHVGCAKSAGSCGPCILKGPKIEKIKIPSLSDLYGTKTSSGVKLIGDGLTCSACSLTYKKAGLFCKEYGLAQDSKMAHCVIPQTVLKKTGEIILDFHNMLCQLKVIDKVREKKLPVILSLNATPSMKKLLLCEQHEIDKVFAGWMEEHIKDEIDESGSKQVIAQQAKGLFYFARSNNGNQNDGYFAPALTIIGKGNLNMFHLGRQCSMCEYFQGDLPFLERLLLVQTCLKAIPLAKKLRHQAKVVSKELWKREIVNERSVLKALRMGFDPRMLGQIIQGQQLIPVEQFVALKFGQPVAGHISMIPDPLERHWTRHLVHLDSNGRKSLLQFLERYVGRHLLGATTGHDSPLDFLLSWMEEELISEIYKRLSDSYEKTPSVPVRVALDLWPCFAQYYTAQLLARCRAFVTLEEIDRIVALHDKYMGRIVELKLWN